jgi:ribosomal protein S18 acetylase RimI-like enzyme
MQKRAPAVGGWRRASAADIPALSAFLQADEEKRVGFSGRLIRAVGEGEPELRLPSALRGSVWMLEGEPAGGRAAALRGALLCHPSRLAFPIFPDDADGVGDRGLALLASSFSPASVLGMASDVERYESAFGLRAKASVAYRLMRLADPNSAGAAPPAAGDPAERPASGPKLALRRAGPADLDELLPLQEAYEREEVLTSLHSFNRAACRASLARALERQLVFAAWEDGVAVAKAGTNARGFGVDQVGGVYAMPERRGRGLASALMALLLSSIREAGRRPALFVKPGNAPARALYRSLGFEDLGDYRADYFEA